MLFRAEVEDAGQQSKELNTKATKRFRGKPSSNNRTLVNLVFTVSSRGLSSVAGGSVACNQILEDEYGCGPSESGRRIVFAIRKVLVERERFEQPQSQSARYEAGYA